ncbi:FAD binding domain-containing protein [Tepidanaerobacter syntrophicus]|uniref:FAD binding domain-containing protein n=1 Tax=Tepidanaerobacter syntrophicus TaxID=224999 RepID=UPI001BD38C6C|nr:FAD binding domain-containing protein [Tepidanaerobacter syntrophicus]
MLPNFELYRPTDIYEACRLKERGALALAGGTDIFVDMHSGELKPEAVVDIKNIAEMHTATFKEDGLEIGALTTHRYIEEWDVVKEHYSALYEACSSVGSVQIRHRGTLGGNICTAAPSADSVGPLLVFDAQCIIIGDKGKRMVPLSNFFVGPKKTILNKDELLCKIVVPLPDKNSGSAFIKYTRRKSMDLALLGVCVYTSLNGDLLEDIRIALSTAAPTPIRAYNTEKMFRGNKVKDISLEEMGKQAALEASPRSSWRASREFRLKLIEELVPYAFNTSISRVKGEKSI